VLREVLKTAAVRQPLTEDIVCRLRTALNGAGVES